MADKYEHAYTNAKGWFEEIRDAYRAANNHAGASTTDDDEKVEQIEERMREGVLSVEVRGGWRTPGAEVVGNDAIEYAVLLTTGGPAHHWRSRSARMGRDRPLRRA